MDGFGTTTRPPLLKLLSQNPSSSFFPAKRHRTFGTLFRSKSQQNWIFGKSKARNFAHVFFCSALLVFVFQLFFWRIMALQSHIWSRTDDIKRMLPMLLYCVSCFGPLISRREKPFKTDNFSPFSQIKLCGICCLASAVLCVVVTVTTTVIHMNRLQTLRECVYQGSIQTCTCFAGFFDPTMTHHDGNNHNRGEDK